MHGDIFKSSQYNYFLPSSFIAQEPVFPPDSCKLLIIDRKKGVFKEAIFRDVLFLFEEGDVIVLNDTKVIKARILGKVRERVLEILLLKEREKGIWEVLVKPGKHARINDTFVFGEGEFTAKILERTPQGGRILKFSPSDIKALIEKEGKVPLPPYIKKDIDDFEKYQTVYAKKEGAVAAPTAGLHFTKELLRQIEERNVKITYITLHCGLATFRPVKTEDIRNHQMESEWVEVPYETVEIVNRAKKEGKRIIAVGTTCVRALEGVSFFDKHRRISFIRPFSGEINLYITPGYQFKIIDGIITNFHTPASTNLILVASFLGLDLLKRAYNFAIERKFRFYSFGDAMFII
jgi:S-adenosylmethionine:tRNA ribosyltransferase-isomerase